jgi:hypothetical protein
MRLLLTCGLALVLSQTVALSQSLKPEAPAPLQPGINKSTVDNMVGTQYWYFTGGPGKTHVHVQFKAMGLLGNAYRSNVTVTLYDESNSWHTPKVLSSDSQPVDYTFEGELKKPTKVLISVAPPSGGLVRMGGDYQIEATGAVTFGAASSADPVIGIYKQMAGYTSLLGASKFLADGTIETASGANGKWKLFDKDSLMYVIDVDGQERHSLKLVPGRGLCDGDIIIFQAVH